MAVIVVLHVFWPTKISVRTSRLAAAKHTHTNTSSNIKSRTQTQAPSWWQTVTGEHRKWAGVRSDDDDVSTEKRRRGNKFE